MIEFSPFEILCEESVGKRIRIHLKDGSVDEGECIGFTRGIDEEDGISNIDIIHDNEEKKFYEYKETDIARIEVDI